jgi:hypothetical protein
VQKKQEYGGSNPRGPSASAVAAYTQEAQMENAVLENQTVDDKHALGGNGLHVRRLRLLGPWTLALLATATLLFCDHLDNVSCQELLFTRR